MDRLRFLLPVLLLLPAVVHADWLDLRRQGPEAELAAARKVAAPEPWIATYAAELPVGHPLSGLKLTVARAPGQVRAGHAALMDVLVRFEGPSALKGVGVVAHAGQVWLRLPGTKAVPMTNDALFQDLPRLGLPLAVFVASETEHLFDVRNEGEFDDVAILRMLPRYEKGPGLQPMKVGVSKQQAAYVLSEVTDREGHALGGALWQETRLDKGLAVHERLRLRPAGHDDAVVELRMSGLKRGKAAGKLVFGPASLK
jgi:hypothetical protein